MTSTTRPRSGPPRPKADSRALRLTDPGTRKVKRHSPRYYWELGRARYWVNNQNFSAVLAKLGPQA